MRISLGQLRRIISEEVTRLRESEQLDMFGSGPGKLGRLGTSKAHRHAEPPDPPPGFELETDTSGGGHNISYRKPDRFGISHQSAGGHSAYNPDTHETVIWDGMDWVPVNKDTKYSGPQFGDSRSMKHIGVDEKDWYRR